MKDKKLKERIHIDLERESETVLEEPKDSPRRRLSQHLRSEDNLFNAVF